MEPLDADNLKTLPENNIRIPCLIVFTPDNAIQITIVSPRMKSSVRKYTSTVRAHSSTVYTILEDNLDSP